MSAVLTAMLGASGGAVLAEAPSPSPAEAAKVTQSADAALREECMYAFATKTFKLQQISGWLLPRLNRKPQIPAN